MFFFIRRGVNLFLIWFALILKLKNAIRTIKDKNWQDHSSVLECLTIQRNSSTSSLREWMVSNGMQGWTCLINWEIRKDKDRSNEGINSRDSLQSKSFLFRSSLRKSEYRMISIYSIRFYFFFVGSWSPTCPSIESSLIYSDCKMNEQIDLLFFFSRLSLSLYY